MENIGNLQTILSLDWKYGLVFIASVIILAVWIIQKFDFLVSRFGFETAKMRKEKKQDEDIAELKQHVERSEPKIDKLYESLDEMKADIKDLSIKVENLQKRMDKNEVSKMGDRLIQSYRYYNEKKQWNEMEKWAFDNLCNSYLESGGDSFVEEKVIPESKTWAIIND